MGKLCLAAALFFAAISLSGCCSPIGPGCATGGCNDCSGAVPTQYIANGPLDALRNARRRLACGAGCGEVYKGEWISTPPVSADPCAGGQFVGGCSGRCRPFCWQPGNLLRGLYGQRFCGGNQSSASCGCSTGGCSTGGCSTGTCGDGGCSAGAVTGEYTDGGILGTGVPVSGSTCTSCAAGRRHTHGTTQVVAAEPARQIQQVQQARPQATRKVIR